MAATIIFSLYVQFLNLAHEIIAINFVFWIVIELIFPFDKVLSSADLARETLVVVWNVCKVMPLKVIKVDLYFHRLLPA